MHRFKPFLGFILVILFIIGIGYTIKVIEKSNNTVYDVSVTTPDSTSYFHAVKLMGRNQHTIYMQDSNGVTFSRTGDIVITNIPGTQDAQ